MSALLAIGAFVFWLLWTYFVYQVGYSNAVKDAETIAGKKLWLRQEAAAKRVRYSNIAPWDEQ